MFVPQLLLLLIFTEVMSDEITNCLHVDPISRVCACCYTYYSGNMCEKCPKCIQQYANGMCRKQCEGHTTYGEYCNKTCPSTCFGGRCERRNGKCMKCKDGQFGQFCKYICDCKGGPCDVETGECINWKTCEHCESGKCYKSVEGSFMCHGKCKGPYYGGDCNKHCPSLCKKCDQGTGSCLPEPKSSTGESSPSNVWVWIGALALLIMAVHKMWKCLGKFVQRGFAGILRRCGFTFLTRDSNVGNEGKGSNKNVKYTSVPPTSSGSGEEESADRRFLMKNLKNDVSLRDEKRSSGSSESERKSGRVEDV